jgi:iron complex transport system substrate-binding protein
LVSTLWKQAREFPANRGTAEEVLRFKPDLVLAGRYAAMETVQMLERLGVRVVVFDYAPDFEGIAAQAREIGELIGERDAAERYATTMLARLERVRAARPVRPLHLLQYEQNGWTHGRGTVLDLLLREAGEVNAASEHGIEWMAQLPLEEVVRMRTDGFIIPRRDDDAPSLAHGVFDHAAFRAISAHRRVITMPAGTGDFGGPSTIDALEYLAAALRQDRNPER